MSASWRERFDRPLVASVLTALIYGSFLLARLNAHNFDPSYFVVAGRTHYDAGSADPSLRSIRDGSGYDGQYYYRLAIEPLSKKAIDHGIAFDAPAYRQQRILYPFLAWVLSAGRPARVPAVLILLNYVGLCVVGWLGGVLSVTAGRHALWGLTFSLYPGFIFTLSRDLTEIIASSLLLAGLFLMRRAHRGVSAACWTAAGLARETTLVVPAVIVLRKAFCRGNANVADMLYYSIPLAVYASWRTYLHWAWVGFPDFRIIGALGWPFLGISDLWFQALAMPTGQAIVWCAETCLLGILVARGLQLYHRRSEFMTEKIALMLYAAMAVCLIQPFWIEDQAFLRITTEIFLLGSMASLLDRTRISQAIHLLWVTAAAITIGWRVEW